jgi:hypothetical protein
VGLGLEDFLFGGCPWVKSCGEDPVFQWGIWILIAGLALDIIGADEFGVGEERLQRDREITRVVHLARPPCLIESRLDKLV